MYSLYARACPPYTYSHRDYGLVLVLALVLMLVPDKTLVVTPLLHCLQDRILDRL